MADTLIDSFLTYIRGRGIPEAYHSLYRDEILAVMLSAGVTSIEHLTSEQLAGAVKAAERQLQNRKAVCAALDEFLRHLRKQSRPPLQVPRRITDNSDLIPRNSSAIPPKVEGEHRRFVRVPFNRDVYISGSQVPIRASDLSLGGMYLETRQSLEAGEVIEVAFKLRATDPHAMRVHARVVYIDPGVGVGIDFKDPPPETQRVLRQFIEDVIADRQF